MTSQGLSKQDVADFYQRHRGATQLAVGFLASLVVVLIMSQCDSTKPGDRSPGPVSMDTEIPEGFVLVPIEVQNFAALDSVLGQFGAVDLYPGNGESQQKSRPIVRGIKIFRSPMNPQNFAVLAPEEKAPSIVAANGPYYVVVQNPTRSGMNFEKPVIRKQRVIVESFE